MEPTTPPNPMPEHELGYEILTKHKEAIRQLRFLANWGPSQLAKVYRIGRSTVNRILKYGAPERIRPTRIGKPRLLTQQAVLDIINYICLSYEHRCLDYFQLKAELHLECSLNQILEPAIEVILEDFRVVTSELGYTPIFMEDGNSAHGHKSITNPCAIFREKHGIQLLNHPSTSPDLNPIEKCWRAIKQSLHRRKIQPTNEIEMANAIIEEWNALDQEWINGLIIDQKHWIWEVVACQGWMTSN
ncbi:hypothetical protein B7463_g8873, partial [Scytalidium lignicola]